VKPRVSVVIVSYRSREALEPCLESLVACAERIPLEVVVVDNASADGTVEWLRACHPATQVIANPDNRGFTRGVNQGLAAARGDFLFVLNPDCEVPPHALERLVGAAQSASDVAAAAPMLLHGDGHPARSCGRFPTLWTLVCDHLGLAKLAPETRWLGGYKYGERPIERLDRVDW
jgi:GT2 family glycosyltransferase